MKTYHEGIAINYDEAANVWVFELRGREHRLASLKLAKEKIDAPAPKEKKPFTRFKAWWFPAYSQPMEVEVISRTDSSAWCTREVWICYVANERRKVVTTDLYPQIPYNDDCMREWRRLKEIADAAEKQLREARAKLKPFDWPNE